MRSFENACVRCAIKRANRTNNKQVGIDYINEWADRMKECKPDIKTVLKYYEKYFKMKKKTENKH